MMAMYCCVRLRRDAGLGDEEPRLAWCTAAVAILEVREPIKESENVVRPFASAGPLNDDDWQGLCTLQVSGKTY